MSMIVHWIGRDLVLHLSGVSLDIVKFVGKYTEGFISNFKMITLSIVGMFRFAVGESRT